MEHTSDIVVLPVESDLTVLTAPRLRHDLDALIDGGCKRIILNMGKATYIDSAGMATILLEIRKMRAAGGLLSLINVSKPAYHSLRRVRVVDFAPVIPADTTRQVPELDPRVEPLWRRVLCSDADHMHETRQRVEHLLENTMLTADEAFDMTLACGEALGNAFDHTDSRYTLVTVSCYPDRVTLDITDTGKGYQLKAGEEPKTTSGSMLERGRGIKLMRLLADEVTISLKSSGKGTQVRLVKMLDQVPESAQQ